MKNNRGVVAETLLVYIIVGLLALFVPNPISSAVGVGIRPNKTIQTEKVELIKDADGNPIALRTITKNDDIQQHVTFWEWLRSLPIFALLLMSLGVIFPPATLVLGSLWSNLKKGTKQIVVGVDKALARVKDDELKSAMKMEMGNVQDVKTKALVNSIQGKN